MSGSGSTIFCLGDPAAGAESFQAAVTTRNGEREPQLASTKDCVLSIYQLNDGSAFAFTRTNQYISVYQT